MSTRRIPWVWIVVVLVAVAIAHSCGYWFGVSNQVTYFLDPLQRAHPELFRHDWLVSSTTLYHSGFAAVARYLFQWDDSGAVGTAIAHVVLMTALVIGVYVTVTGATARRGCAVFVLIAAWLTIDGDRSLAGSYLWSGYLQPSLLATVGWVFALAAFARGRPFATGILLAAAGLFHVNFLLLGIGIFALAEIASDRRGLLRRLALLLLPQLFALALLAPELFASAHSSDPKLALWILVRYHAAVHYFPFRVRHSLPILVRWVALAVVVAPIAIEYGRSVAVRRLVNWCWIAGALCTLAVFVLMIPPLMPLTRLYVWRLGPFAQLAGMFVIALAVASTIEDPSRWRTQPRWRRVSAVALAAWNIWETPSDPDAAGGWVLALVAVAIVAAMFVAPRARAWLVVAVAVGSLGIVLGSRWSTIVDPHAEVVSFGPDTDALFAWARTSTPVDAVFLTPPQVGAFRLLARRAIVVDFKSPPLLPDEITEWYRRLGVVAGDPATKSLQQTQQQWLDSTGEQLLSRARTLGADYLVLDRTAAQANLPRAPVYSNGIYVVYETTR